MKRLLCFLVGAGVALAAASSFVIAQTQPPPPPTPEVDSAFTGFNQISPLSPDLVCGPMVMNFGRENPASAFPPPAPQQQNAPPYVHGWYAQATANSLTVRLNVANFGKQVVTIFSPSGSPLGSRLVDATALCQPQFGGFQFAFGIVSVPTTPGAIHRIEVRLLELSSTPSFCGTPPSGTLPPPADSGRHYRLSVSGGKALAINTPSFSILEPLRAVMLLSHAANPLEVAFTRVAWFSPPGATNRVDLEFTPPSSSTIFSSVVLSDAAPTVSVPLNGPSGLWRMIAQAQEHYVTTKKTGDDRHLYSRRSCLLVDRGVRIDIKPNSDPNSFGCNAVNSSLPVAILGEVGFDATTVDADSVLFGRNGGEAAEAHRDQNGNARRHVEDVNKDGRLDMVFHFRFGDTGFSCADIPAGQNSATVTGVLTGNAGGTPIVGSDALRLTGGA